MIISLNIAVIQNFSIALISNVVCIEHNHEDVKAKLICKWNVSIYLPASSHLSLYLKSNQLLKRFKSENVKLRVTFTFVIEIGILS